MKYRMECHTSQHIDILSNPTKKGLSLIIQNMNDSAICGFLKMPPPHKNRPALANATCHQAACVRRFQCPSVRMEYSPGISVCSPSRAVPVLLLSDTAGPRGSKGKCRMCKYKAKRDVMSSFFLFDWNEENTEQKKNELECSLSAVGYLSTSAVKQTSLFLIQVSQDGKALLDVLQRPLSPGNSESLTATANYSKAVHQVLDVVHEVLHHQRRLESIWQHRKVRLHQRLQLCVFQQDVQQVISLLKR